MNSRKRVLAALLGGRTDRVPVISANQTATLEQMNKIDIYFPEAHLKAEPMAKLAAEAYHQLSLEAVGVPFCQTVEAEVLGCEIRAGGKTDTVSVVTHPYTTEDYPELSEDLYKKARIPEVIKAVKILKSELGDKVPVIARIVGPFTIAAYLISVNEALINSMTNPELLKPLLKLGTDFAREYSAMLIKAGADIICVEDMTASTDMIRPETYKELIFPYHKELFADISAPSILHICGNVSSVLETMAATGADGLSIEAKAVEKDQLNKIKNRVTIIGDIPPSDVLLSGSREEVNFASREALDNGVDILAPGCGIPPETSTANIKEMVSVPTEYSPSVNDNDKVKTDSNNNVEEDIDNLITEKDGLEIGRLIARNFIKNLADK